MKKIKSFSVFNEELSGTEMVGQEGGVFGDTRQKNKTLTYNDARIIYSDKANKFYTSDMYFQLYMDYIKNGGNEATRSFTKKNIDIILSYFKIS